MAVTGAAPPDAIRYRSVSKRYGSVAALSTVTLAVRQGEFFGVVGENGAGKTTLMKCLLDFCATDAGEIDIFGASSKRVQSRAALAYLPERFSPPFYLTGEDYLRYMARLYGHPHDEVRMRAMLARLELDSSVLARPARTSSKGMTQKLALAACLLSGKPLFVLDEPASGLDPKARALLKRELRALHAAGSTLLVASHALADVEALCDRIAVMHRGALRFVGTPAELKARHATDDIEEAYLACVADALPC